MDGEVLFDGPVTTDEEKDNLSPELKKRLEKVEKNLISLQFYTV